MTSIPFITILRGINIMKHHETFRIDFFRLPSIQLTLAQAPWGDARLNLENHIMENPIEMDDLRVPPF
jgi:hypothetical protein